MLVQNRETTSLRQTLIAINGEGYQLEFRRESTCIYSFELRERIVPADFTVDKFYYFEDAVNPDADRVLYAISLANGNKGFLIDVCNVYSDNISYELEQKLQWEYPLF